MTIDVTSPTRVERSSASGIRRLVPLAPRVGPLAGVLLVAVLPWLVPGWTSFLVVVGIFFLIVLGLDVFLGHTGQVSLGQTLFMALGGYGAGILSLRLGVPVLVAILLMALLSATVAYLLGRPFLRLRGYYLALATLGLAVITQSLANGLDGLTGGPSGLVGVPNVGIGGWVATSEVANYYVVAVVGLAAAWFVRGVTRSRTGRAWAAIAGDHHAAAMLGIDPARYKTRAFMLSAVLASVGGSLYACYTQFVSPDLVGVAVAFNLVVMLALGGSRSIVGPLLGAFLLQALPQAGQSIARYEPLLAGIVLVVVITYLPEGIWGALRGLAGRWWSRWA